MFTQSIAFVTSFVQTKHAIETKLKALSIPLRIEKVQCWRLTIGIYSQVITMEMDLKQSKAEIQRLQTERDRIESVKIIAWKI